jgi:hypothetical protein
MAQRMIYHWKHGWIPLDHYAALSKAHGSEHGALRYLPGGKGQTVSPRRMSDNELADHLGAVADDERAVDAVLHELDRRDRERERDISRRKAAADVKSRRFDEAVAGGEDPLTAYSKVYGVSEERLRRQEVIRSLRASGHKGAGLDELLRSAHSEHVRQSYLDAGNVTRGVLRNKAGEVAGIPAAALFSGPESRARKYASRELLDYWQVHGRLTVADFKAATLGGYMPSASTGAFS